MNLKADPPAKSFAIFDSEKLLEISLDLDLKSYLKKDLKKPIDAVLTFHLNESDSITKNVKVNNRGTYRSSNCFYPTLEINFKKPIQAFSEGGKIYGLKLITCCESGDLYNEYILREYLVYKMYNVLTDKSYRVRLLRVNFVDSQKKRKSFSQYGFFLEPNKILGDRIDSKVLKSTDIGQKHVVPEVMDRLAIFNYMVSSTDWSVKEQHNVTLLQTTNSNSSGLILAVPHDFDLTGVVNAVYAAPSAGSGLKSVRERIYLGPCRSNEIFIKDLKEFIAKKELIYKVIKDFPYLDIKSKKDITGFLDQFYDQIEKQKGIENLIAIFKKSCNN